MAPRSSPPPSPPALNAENGLSRPDISPSSSTSSADRISSSGSRNGPSPARSGTLLMSSPHQRGTEAQARRTAPPGLHHHRPAASSNRLVAFDEHCPRERLGE